MSIAEDVLLRSLEEQLLKPEVRGSPDAVGYLLADEFIEFGNSGRVYDKRQIIEALQQETPDPTTRISLVDFVARRLASEVILVTYRTIRPDRPESCLRSSIWKLIEGRWQMVFHQGTPSRISDR